MITKILIFHESGIPVYMWPKEEETVSLFSSFFSAIQQFSKANFDQNILLIGLERDNIMFLRYKEYILSLVFTDRNEIALIDRVSRRIMREIGSLLDREIDELQFDTGHFAMRFKEALAKSGIFWLFQIASMVVQQENIMGVSIFEIDVKEGVKPLYYPVEPYLGFERIMSSVLSSIKVLKILRVSNISPLDVMFLAKNGNGIRSLFFSNFVALLEYLIENADIKKLENVLGEKQRIRLGIHNIELFYEIVFNLCIDVLGDLPVYCQVVTNDGNIVLDFTEEDVKSYMLPPGVDILNIIQTG